MLQQLPMKVLGLNLFLSFHLQGPEKFWFIILVGIVVIFQSLTTDIYVFKSVSTAITTTFAPNTTHISPVTFRNVTNKTAFYLTSPATTPLAVYPLPSPQFMNACMSPSFCGTFRYLFIEDVMLTISKCIVFFFNYKSCQFTIAINLHKQNSHRIINKRLVNVFRTKV